MNTRVKGLHQAVTSLETRGKIHIAVEGCVVLCNKPAIDFIDVGDYNIAVNNVGADREGSYVITSSLGYDSNA